MAKKHEITDSTTFQAVCSNGDFFGPFETTRGLAEGDAAGHNAKPGCENHKVKVVKTTTEVKFFAAKAAAKRK